MKKLTIASLLLTVILPCTAQDSLKIKIQKYHKAKESRIYLLGGPSYLSTRGLAFGTPVTWNSASLQKVAKSGYSVGLGISHDFSKHFAFSAQFFWERKRFALNDSRYYLYDSAGQFFYSKKYATSTWDVSNDYITISMIPQFLFAKHFSIGVGAYFGILIRSSTLLQDHYPTQQEVRYNSINEYDKYDSGLSFNLGYTYPCKQFIFTLQFTNNYGLKNIPTGNGGGVQANLPWCNNSYSILLSISYSRLNKKIFSNKHFRSL